jgi:hypothetical protein
MCESTHAMNELDTANSLFPSNENSRKSEQMTEHNQHMSFEETEETCGSTAKRDDFSSHLQHHTIQFHSTKLNKFSQNFNAQLIHPKISMKHQNQMARHDTYR